MCFNPLKLIRIRQPVGLEFLGSSRRESSFAAGSVKRVYGGRLRMGTPIQGEHAFERSEISVRLKDVASGAQVNKKYVAE